MYLNFEILIIILSIDWLFDLNEMKIILYVNYRVNDIVLNNGIDNSLWFFLELLIMNKFLVCLIFVYCLGNDNKCN